MNFAELYGRAFSWPIAQEAERCQQTLDLLGTPTPNRIIDVGAGTGRFLPFFASFSSRYVAVEPDAEMRAQLQTALASYAENFVSARIIPLPFEDAPVIEADAIFMLTDVVSYLSKPGQLERFLDATARGLPFGGALVIDCAIWDGHAGDERGETWDMETGNGNTVLAACDATTFEANGGLRRTERLRFRFSNWPSDAWVEQKSELLAFTIETLTEVMERSGFEHVCAVNDRGAALSDAPAGRGWFGFRRCEL